MSVTGEVKAAATGVILLCLLRVIPPSLPQGEGGRLAISGEDAPVQTGDAMMLFSISM